MTHKTLTDQLRSLFGDRLLYVFRLADAPTGENRVAVVLEDDWTLEESLDVADLEAAYTKSWDYQRAVEIGLTTRRLALMNDELRSELLREEAA